MLPHQTLLQQQLQELDQHKYNSKRQILTCSMTCLCNLPLLQLLLQTKNLNHQTSPKDLQVSIFLICTIQLQFNSSSLISISRTCHLTCSSLDNRIWDTHIKCRDIKFNNHLPLVLNNCLLICKLLMCNNSLSEVFSSSLEGRCPYSKLYLNSNNKCNNSKKKIYYLMIYFPAVQVLNNLNNSLDT